MRILVVNCNTSEAITAEIAAIASVVASPGTSIVATQPSWGVESAEGFYESFITAAAVLDVLTTYDEPYDAVIMAGFGEHGREGARQLLEVPVVDITEAAVAYAALIGHRFGVVTTLRSAIGSIEHSLLAAGATERCVGIEASDIPVLEASANIAITAAALAASGRELIRRGADVLVLGCAGFAGLDQLLEDELGVPVIDGVAAAVTLAEGLVRLGKSTSKAGAYAPPRAGKSRPGWPVSSAHIAAPKGTSESALTN